MSDVHIETLLETPRLRVRALVESDAIGLHEAYGDPETMRYWDAPPSRSVAETAAHIRQSRAMSADTHAAFAVTLRDSGLVVGMVNYHDRRPRHHLLSVGWLLAKPWWRQGIMREAMPTLLTHCFDRLDTHRIEARIEPRNVASARLAGRLGFAREGLMRDCVFVGEQPRSQHLYALLYPFWARRDGRPAMHGGEARG